MENFFFSVLTPYTFSIGDTSSEEFKPYEGGGMFMEVKIATVMSFVSKALYNRLVISTSIYLLFEGIYVIKNFEDFTCSTNNKFSMVVAKGHIFLLVHIIRHMTIMCFWFCFLLSNVPNTIGSTSLNKNFFNIHSACLWNH